MRTSEGGTQEWESFYKQSSDKKGKKDGTAGILMKWEGM